MESNEEYLLRALRRTNSGLADSLIPSHSAKLLKLLAKFESAGSITEEVRTLLGVQGFGKCALAMEWLLERTRRSSDIYAAEQFESDVLLLNEKLFEAFLNQPFDMPDFSRSFEAPARPIQQNIQVSDDEFLGASYPHLATSFEQEQARGTGTDSSQESIASPNWNAPASGASNDSFITHSGMTETQSDTSPSLSDAMTPDLLEATERISQTAIEFLDKQSGERPVAMAVLRVTVRAALDAAKTSGNIIVQDFYEAFLRLIAFADEQGKIKNDAFAEVIRDVGDRLSSAMKHTAGGVTLLKNITLYINDPAALFSKK